MTGTRRNKPFDFTMVLVALLGLALPVAASAQDAPPAWIQLNVVDVQPTMVDEFLAVQRELMESAKKAKTPWRTVSRTEVFGDTYRFLIASPVESLSVFDKRGENDRTLISRAERCITARRSYAVRALYDVGNPLPEDEEADLMLINMVTVAPGREQEYMDLMTTELLPHFKEEKMHHVAGAVSIGGEGGFIHVFYVDDFAELDKGSPAMRALGAQGAAEVTAKFSGIVIRNELWVARVVSDASYSALPEETDDP